MSEHEPIIVGNCDSMICLGCECGWRGGECGDGTTWGDHRRAAAPVADEAGEQYPGANRGYPDELTGGEW